MTPEEEVQFWRRFWSESLRVYGDKRGTYRELAIKAMERLAFECLSLIGTDAADLPERIRKACDEKARSDWGKSRDPGAVIQMYLALIDPIDARLPPQYRVNKDAAPMDKNDAIKKVAEAFGFQSFAACYQFLKREGVKGLPSTWPK
jgi:hypothetical protein